MIFLRRALLLTLTVTGLHGASPNFTRDIQPIFQGRCIMCHGAQVQMAGLRLDNRELALKGSASGPVIKPHSALSSRLIVMVTGAEKKVMPPSGPPLTDAQVSVLKAWINAGAIWPDSARIITPASAVKLWSLQPVARPLPPPVKDRAWPANEIDRFVLARLEA